MTLCCVCFLQSLPLQYVRRFFGMFTWASRYHQHMSTQVQQCNPLKILHKTHIGSLIFLRLSLQVNARDAGYSSAETAGWRFEQSKPSPGPFRRAYKWRTPRSCKYFENLCVRPNTPLQSLNCRSLRRPFKLCVGDSGVTSVCTRWFEVGIVVAFYSGSKPSTAESRSDNR